MSVSSPAGPPTNPPTHSMISGHATAGNNAAATRGQTYWGGSVSPGGPGRTAKRYPHLDDLVARSTPDLDLHAPMRALLHKADICAKQADTHLDFRRPDLAYTEFLTASTIVVELVPRHKDFPSLSTSHGELWNLNKALQKRINAQHDKFGAVREMIKDDNLRSGVRPTFSRDQARSLSPTPRPVREALASPTPGVSLSDDSAQHHPSEAPPSYGQEHTSRLQASHERPPIHRKPDNLHGRTLQINGVPNHPVPPGPADPLAERFARLRTLDIPRSPTPQPNPDGRLEPSHSRPGSSSSGRHKALSTDGRPWSDDTPASSVTSLPHLTPVVSAPTTMSLANRPAGPRNMPPPSPTGPPHPPKLPLPAPNLLASMPRQPSPTYSPARNLPGPASIDPPRTTARSIAGASGRPSSMPTAGTGPQSYSSDRTTGPPSQRHSDVHLPQASAITVHDLHEYLKRGSDQLSILFIDVRLRPQFDEGHIFAQSIICIEPIALRPDISADELRESLVLSPESEQILFEWRHEFDLVVYYDQNATGSTLPSLRQALVEFNYDRPLCRPPVTLIGGLDAWVDLVGEQALQTSDTAGLNGRQSPSTVKRSGRPLGRMGKASTTPRLEARRRLREHEPLNVEEENAWLERVRGDGGVRSRPGVSRVGSDVLSRTHPLRGQASSATDEAEAEAEASFVRTYDDFLRRYPEASDVRESMVSPPSTRGTTSTIIDHPFHNFTGIQSPPQPIHPPPDVPYEPSSLVPKTPSRPPPSVPRKSYGGVSEKISYPARAQAYPPTSAPAVPGAEAISARHSAQISRTGLTNFGATCYMNAVIQCLSATAPLTRYFLDGGYQRAVQRNKWGSNGVLPKVYHSLMWHLWHGEYTYIAPKTFREFVSRLNKDFENANVQHDANDFFVFLLDALHEDLNVNFARPRPPNLTEAEERKREAVPPQVASRIEWNRWSQTNFSWISSLFSGQHMSRLRCPVCGFQSTSYETFNSISLEIPKKGRAHIYDCLKNYTKEERLSAEDRWTCPDCKVPREASKRITITRAPQILVLQLKRFRSVRRGFTDKNNAFIDFPLTRLDLRPYTLPPMGTADEQTARGKFGPEIVAPLPECSPPFEYDAYAVVQHFGTLTGGHYKALIREDTRGHWMEFNDKVASNFDPRRVASEAAYLLFYVRSHVR
ncbi:MAG: ubiquitin-specific protease doa4 [Thelocarpon superellum]|nr:MAG: ubiquitin-specific protease doa4 [Thelocarpon superellum]